MRSDEAFGEDIHTVLTDWESRAKSYHVRLEGLYDLRGEGLSETHCPFHGGFDSSQACRVRLAREWVNLRYEDAKLRAVSLTQLEILHDIQEQSKLVWETFRALDLLR